GCRSGPSPGPVQVSDVHPFGYGWDDPFEDMSDTGAPPALLRVEAHGSVVALGNHEVGPAPALSAQLVLEAVEERRGGAGAEMVGMDVDEGELTETGRIRQPVEHLGGVTRRAHPAEAQAPTVSGPVDDEGRDRCFLVGEVRRPGGGLTVMVQSIEDRIIHDPAVCAAPGGDVDLCDPFGVGDVGRANSELGHGLSLSVREGHACECVRDDATGLCANVDIEHAKLEAMSKKSKYKRRVLTDKIGRASRRA